MLQSARCARGVFAFIVSLFLTAGSAAAATAVAIAPTAAPHGARLIVTGTGLDANVAVAFASSGSPVAARVVTASATMLDVVVPMSALSGTVRVTSGDATIGTFAFDVTPDSSFIRVRTLAASDKGHDLLKQPGGIAVLPTGAVCVVDTGHNQLRLIQPNGVVTILAGSGKSGLTDGIGAAAEFKSPRAVAFDAVRNVLYIADTGNNVIRRVLLDGTVSTLAGSGRPDSADGAGAQASFKQPSGVVVDGAGTIYVADTGNSRIRRITFDGRVTTLAGGLHEGLTDGPALQALFKQPEGIAIDANGVVYVADTKNNVIRKLQNGSVSTVAGTGHDGAIDGPLQNAEFKEPVALALDDSGNIFVADSKTHSIRKISLLTSSVTTLAGTGKPGMVDGSLAMTQFKEPGGIALAGAIYIADSGNDAVRIVDPQLLVNAVVPNHGPVAGGNVVRILGTGFVPGLTQVTIGGASIASADLTFVAPTELLGSVPPHSTAENVDVVVTTATGSASVAGGYAYENDAAPAPSITSIAPARGPAAGGTAVTLTGTNFAANIVVTIGGVRATQVSVTSSSTLTALTAAGPAGLADVMVTTSAGSATLPGAYTYVGAPAIAGFSPMQGAPGTTVTISGHDFDVASVRVAFGSLPAVIVSVTSSQIVTVAPPGVSTGRIRVTTDGGAATSANDFVVAVTPTFDSLTLSAPTLRVDVGQEQQVNAIGLRSGVSSDVSTQVVWSVSDSNVAAISAAGVVTGRAPGTVDVRATLGSLSATMRLTLQPLVLPPDPRTVAPVLDKTVVPAFAEEIRFLYAGPTPVQTGVSSGTIVDERVSVLRGVVRDRSGAPIPGVSVTVLKHPEYGETRTRADGVYDFAVNGGGSVTLEYRKAGRLSAQRVIATQWNEQRAVADVVLLAFDPIATRIDFTAAAMQVARGSLSTDADGPRRATLLFAPGTLASMTLPDGSRQDATSLTIRATEFTLGATGRKAMPANLPPTSAYTYCAEMSADEAETIGAKTITFSKPVISYLENFLAFRVGTPVPVGYFDRGDGAWHASPNGLVIGIVAVTDGVASIDLNGDGIAEDVPSLEARGIGLAERQTIATLYTAGQSLWRVPMTHFTPYDSNFPYELPLDAKGPHNRRASRAGDPSQQCQEPGHSLIDCANQTLGESLAVAGTPFHIEYNTSRIARGRYQSTVHVSESTPPSSMLRMEVSVEVAGRSFQQTFAPQANQDYTFLWDGQDVYGRTAQGSRSAKVTVSWVYPGIYVEPGQTIDPSWAAPGVYIPFRTVSRVRAEAAFDQVESFPLGGYSAPESGFGGWTLDAQQFYDPNARVMFGSAGTVRSADPQSTGVTALYPIAGTGDCCDTGDGGPATTAKLNYPSSIAIAPDGSIYMSEWWLIRKIDPAGIISTIIGTGSPGFSPDGTPAASAAINAWDIAVGPDGSLYINDQSNMRVRRVVNGVLTTVAGNGIRPGNHLSVDGVPATTISVHPSGIAVGPDGTLYIADDHRILRVAADGIVNTLAGGSTATDPRAGNGGPAVSAAVSPSALAVAADGTVYFSENLLGVVRSITPDGIIDLVAGTYFGTPVVDGDLATSGPLKSPWGVTVAPDGRVLVTELAAYRVRAIAANGIIRTIAGTGQYSYDLPKGDLSQASALAYPYDVKIAPDGGLVIDDYYKNAILRATELFPALKNTALLIPSADGGVAYSFVGRRHAATVDTTTGATILSLGYERHNYLSTINDRDANQTTIERDTDGNLVAIVAPYGQRTTFGITDGRLASMTNPDGSSYHFEYDEQGLLTKLVDLRGGIHEYAYDSLGFLMKDLDPAGGFVQLARSGNGDDYSVARISAEGETQRHDVHLKPGVSETRLYIGADGLTNTSLLAGATKTRALTSGVVLTRTQSADPRFGMQAPLNSTSQIRMPSGLALGAVYERRATLTDPLNVLTLSQLVDVKTVNGKKWTTTYTAGTRTLESVTPMGRRSTITTDSIGRVASLGVGTSSATTFTYDEHGRVRILSDGARQTRYAYDASGRLASVTDPTARTTSFGYNAMDLVNSKTLSDGSLVRIGYDADGNATSLTTPKGYVHAFEFSPVGLLVKYTSPGSATTHYDYDRDRKLVLLTRPDQSTVKLDYDAAHRLSAVTVPGSVTSLSYSALGQLTGLSNNDVQLTYSYDGDLMISASLAGLFSASINYGYDTNFRLVSENGIPFGYDADGLLIVAGALTIQRDASNGTIASSSLGNVQDTWSYNIGGEPIGYSVSAQATPVFSEELVRDDYGRITQRRDTMNSVTTVFDYAYDDAARLHSVTRNNLPAASYDYDADGNRARKSDGITTEVGAYDSEDRLLSYGDVAFTYSTAGELRSRSDNHGVMQFTYDAVGNMRRADLPDGRVIEYVIDPQNRRVGKRVNGVLVRGWVYSGALRIIAEVDGAGVVTSKFVYGTRLNIPDYMIKNGRTYRIVSDHLGSPRAVVDVESGVVQQQLGFDEFGNVLSDSNPEFQPFGFAGGLYDRDTKLVRFGTRDYDSQTGRWTTKDPAAFGGGDTNLYAYVLGDPVNLIDPWGTDAYDTVANVSAGIGDALLFGFGDEVREWSDRRFHWNGGALVNRCSDAYRASTAGTSAVMLAAGTARIGYAAGAKGIALGSATAEEAVLARNAMKVAGRLGLNDTARVYTAEQMLTKYGTEEAVIAAAGRTNTGFNLGGAGFVGGGIRGLLNLPECGCDN